MGRLERKEEAEKYYRRREREVRELEGKKRRKCWEVDKEKDLRGTDKEEPRRKER